MNFLDEMNKLKFSIKTLGCKVNQYEEQVIRENLLRFGFSEAGPLESDLAIVNSCTVTGQADVKTRRIVRRLIKDNPGMKVFITGCYAVMDEDIKKLDSMPGVYMVVPNENKTDLPAIINSVFDPSDNKKDVLDQVSSFFDHSRAFLKIQDGCDQKCSYCKVNIVRGPSKSRDEQEILLEVDRLTQKGYKEIVLTGICLGSWGSEKGSDLAGLLKEISKRNGDFRIRLSSIEPNHVTNALIDQIESSRKICRHLHIPLQSGSDEVLRAMNRRYNTSDFRKIIKKIRDTIEFAGITMDIIAGFPGETDDDFNRTMDFVREIRPSRLHVFKYSDRKGTPSFDMKSKVPVDIARKRVDMLINEGKQLQGQFAKQFIGREVEVLIEKQDEDKTAEGYTGEYVRTRITGIEDKEGQIITAKVNSFDNSELCVLSEVRRQ